MWTNRNSSDYTKRLQDRTRFAAYLQNKESVTTGNAVTLPIDSGSGKNGANSEWTNVQHGMPFVSAEEYSTIVGTPSYILPDPTELVVQTFTTTGVAFWTVPRLTRSVEYLIVGGGGGSGPGYNNGGGGGGGAGVVLSGSIAVRGDQRYTIIVGDGGAAGTVTDPVEVSGGTGQTSSFGTLQAVGGSGGFGSRIQTGGSGAGGAIATATSGGGSGRGGGASGGGGGGGGNGSAGGNKSGATAGTGGSGISSSISGSAVTYGAGGAGATGNFTSTGVAGTANTGNGAKGGGGASGQQGQGAKGGSGIVILRFYQ